MPGDHQLRAGQRDRVRALRMVRGDQLEGPGHPGPGQVTKVFRLLAELLEIPFRHPVAPGGLHVLDFAFHFG